LLWPQPGFVRIGYLPGRRQAKILGASIGQGRAMQRGSGRSARYAVALAALAVFALGGAAAIKNMAVVAAAHSKLADLPLADLVKPCKGTPKTWPAGKIFVLLLKTPAPPDMHGVLQKLFSGGPAEARAAIAKLNESRQVVKIVNSDEDLLRVVD